MYHYLIDNIKKRVSIIFKLVLKLFHGKSALVFGTLLGSIVISLDSIAGPYYMVLFTNSITRKHYEQVPRLTARRLKTSLEN